MSVDALRGFAMFWLIGGQTALLALVEYLDWPWLKDYVTREFEHPPWHGFHWWDTVMPTFIFVSGLTIPLSITRRLEQGEARSTLYLRIRRRLARHDGAERHPRTGHSIIYDWHQMRFMGVLARIALSYSLAAVIVMHTTPRRQAAWAHRHPDRLLGGDHADTRAGLRPRNPDARGKLCLPISTATCCPARSWAASTIGSVCIRFSPRSRRY